MYKYLFHPTIDQIIGLAGRVFANVSVDRDSIVNRVIQKSFKKWYLIPPCLKLGNIRYVSRVKWSNLRRGVAPSTTLQCSSY